MGSGVDSQSAEAANPLLTRATELFDAAAGDPVGCQRHGANLVGDARSARNHEALVVALRALAEAHRLLLEHDRALALLHEAARVARRHTLHERLGEVLMTRGIVRFETGRADDGRRDLERATDLVRPELAVEIDLRRAALAHNSGRLEEAARLYAGVLDRPSVADVVRTKASNNLGVLEATRGRFARAERWLDQAASSARSVGPARVAIVAETRAWVVVQAGRLTEGVRRFDEAIRLWEAAELPLGELHAEYADALLNLRLLPEARRQAERAATEMLSRGVDLMGVEAQLRAAALALTTGDPRAAEHMADDTVTRLMRQRRVDWASRARLVVVEARLAQGCLRSHDHATAARAARALTQSGDLVHAADGYLIAGRVAARWEQYARAAVDWKRAAALTPRGTVLTRVKGHLARALAAQVRDDDEELLRACRQGLADLAKHRAALPSTELRALASGHGAELSMLGLGAVQRNRPAGQVLAWMESTRAAALSAVEPGPTEGLEDELGTLRAVQAEVARARRTDRSALPALLSRQSEVEARIRHSGWLADSVDTGRGLARSFSVTALRQALAHRTLVEYDVYDGQIVAVVAGERRTRIVQVADRATVEAEIDELRSALHALNACVPQMAAFLYDTCASLVDRLRALLIKPLEIRDPGSVVVVPVGELQRVPWSAMFDCPVSVAPSAALWMDSLAAPVPSGPVVLAAGPDLAAATREVEALAARHERPLVLTPPHSGVEAVKKALDGAALAHLSCHGEVRADNPTFSSLHLSDGNLTVHELDRRGGVPHRLVLAACDVGGSVTYPGNEVLGFIGTLLTRGGAGVVASTMLVLDEHVTPLMLTLHDGVRAGLTLADALHQARGAVDLADPRAYPAWCSFTAYGAA